jgi:hypothetical protein
MPNGGTEGVAHHFLKNHTDLNVRIRTLKVLPGAAKKNPDFMKESNWNDTHTHSPGHTHTYHCVTDTHFPLSLTPTSNIDRALCTYMTSYLAHAYRLSILIDKTTLFINSWLTRL